MIDPNIALQVRPPQVNDPLETMGRVMQLKQAQQQMQLAPLQLQNAQMETEQRQMDLQDQHTMRNMLPGLLQENGGDWDKAIMGLAPHVSPKTAMGLQTVFLGNKEKRAQIEKATADAAQANAAVQQKEHDYLGSLALGIRKADYSPAVFDAALEHAGQLNPAYQQHIGQIRQAVAQNPDSLKQIVDGLISGSEPATKEGREQAAADLNKPVLQAAAAKADLEQFAQEAGNVTDQAGWVRLLQKYPRAGAVAPAAFGPDAVAAVRRMVVPVKDQPEFDINSYKAKMGVLGNGEFDQFLAQFAKSKGKTSATIAPQEFFDGLQKFAELKQDPTMRDLAVAQRGLANTMARMQMAQMPTDADYQTLAKSLIDKSLSPTQFNELKAGRMGQISPSKVFLLAKQMDPTFSLGRAEGEFKAYEKTEADFTSGKEAGLIRSNNNALEHLALLEEARLALKNGDIPSLQRIANYFGTQTGGSAATMFDHIAGRVGDEVQKAFIPGGGSAGERGEAGKGSYASGMGDAQIAGNIRADVRLMDSQQRHLVDQYHRGTYGQGGQQLFTPEAMAARDRLLGVKSGGQPSGQAASTPAVPPLPTSLSAADIGKVYVSPKTGKAMKITAVNPQNPKQFTSEEVK